MNVPSELRYTKTHEWAKATPAEVLVGITSHAQEELRDIVYIELPVVGKQVTQGEPVAVIESVKAAFDIYAPVSGTVTKTNAQVSKSPQLVNQDCYGNGWLFAIQSTQPGELANLMTAETYASTIASSAH